jgi:hypothetical protein
VSLIAFAEQIEQLPLSVAIAESQYAFPAIEGVHLIGLSIAVGLLFITDLRLAGFILRGVPASQVLRQLRPWILGGFASIFITGGVLFFAEATTLVTNPAFKFKLLFIALAAVNAAYFEFVIAKHAGADLDRPQSAGAIRFAGLASLTLWTVVIVCGRLIPYLPSSPV